MLVAVVVVIALCCSRLLVAACVVLYRPGRTHAGLACFGECSSIVDIPTTCWRYSDDGWCSWYVWISRFNDPFPVWVNTNQPKKWADQRSHPNSRTSLVMWWFKKIQLSRQILSQSSQCPEYLQSIQSMPWIFAIKWCSWFLKQSNGSTNTREWWFFLDMRRSLL